MGEKDENSFFGDPIIFIGKSDVSMKPLKIVRSELNFDGDSNSEKPLSLKSSSFECQVSLNSIDPILGFAQALQPYNCSLIIQGKSTIGKPQNLRYPNKKRARRIWKKWIKRFGIIPGKSICVPNVKMEVCPEI